MFKEPRTTRRIGEIINANDYCENRNYVSRMMAMLFRYRWFDQPIQLNSEIAEALYELSHGVIYFLIKAYIEMHCAYYSETPRPNIDAAFIRYSVRPRMEHLYQLLQDTVTRNTMRSDLDAALRLDAKRQDEFSQKCLEIWIGEDRLRENVCRNVASILGSEIDSSSVAAAYSKVIDNPKQKKSEQDLTKAVVKLLSGKRAVSKKKMITPISIEEMRTSVLEKA